MTDLLPCLITYEDSHHLPAVEWNQALRQPIRYKAEYRDDLAGDQEYEIVYIRVPNGCRCEFP